MVSDEEIIEELRVRMIERGWSRPKADAQSRMWFEFLAPRVREQAAERIIEKVVAASLPPGSPVYKAAVSSAATVRALNARGTGADGEPAG